MELKDRVKAARLHAGLSQKVLAARAGFTQQAMSALERGEAQESAKLTQLAMACGVSPAWLAKGEGQMIASQSVRGHTGIITSRRLALNLSVEQVHERLLKQDWRAGLTPPDLETVGKWFSGDQRPFDVDYKNALYQALELDIQAASMAAAIEPTTAASHEILARVERMDASKQAALLAMLKVME